MTTRFYLLVVMKGRESLRLQGWIIYNGNLPGKKFIDFANMLHQAAAQKQISTSIYKNNELLSILATDSININSPQLPLPDFVIFTDKDIYLANQLELLGIRVFNPAKAIMISDDKIATYQRLAQHQLAIPKTIIAPKVFYQHENIDYSFLNIVSHQLKFPMIVKEAFGSFGEQVYLVQNEEELRGKVKELIGKPFVFQEFISTSYGKDIRLQVVGNQVVASMLRTSTNDFRANITSGGTMTAYEPTKKEAQLAIQATKAIGADFAGVDLLFGANNEPIICEVNSNAHIRNLYECTNINAAQHIIDYVIHTISRGEER